MIFLVGSFAAGCVAAWHVSAVGTALMTWRWLAYAATLFASFTLLIVLSGPALALLAFATGAAIGTSGHRALIGEFKNRLPHRR